jgi:hypothetical protein
MCLLWSTNRVIISQKTFFIPASKWFRILMSLHILSVHLAPGCSLVAMLRVPPCDALPVLSFRFTGVQDANSSARCLSSRGGLQFALLPYYGFSSNRFRAGHITHMNRVTFVLGPFKSEDQLFLHTVIVPHPVYIRAVKQTKAIQVTRRAIL